MKEKKENIKKIKLSKEEKKLKKQKKRDDWLQKRGINKVYTTYIVEVLFIFIVELIAKGLLNSFALDWTLLRIFISSNLLAFFLCLITSNMKNGLRRAIIIIFDLLVSFYAWLQLGFMGFLGAFMSLGNAEQGTKITDYIFDFLFSYDWKVYLLYVPFIIVILYLIFERRMTKSGFSEKIEFKNIFKDIAIVLYIALLADLFYMTLDVDFMQNKYQTITNKSLFKYPSNPSMTIKNFGTTVYLMLDIKGTLGGEIENVYAGSGSNEDNKSLTRIIDDTAWESLIATEENDTMNTLNNYFINRNITETNDYTGLFKDKNVIMIMLESVSQAVFSEKYSTYFPTLYKLYTEGITGVNNYSPKNNCATGESEMTSQVSLYSIETTCTVNTYRKNVYPEALLNMLQKNNYYTSSYHDYTDQYYYRTTYEPNFGAMNYYGVTELGMKYNPIYKEWPSDLTFMEQALPQYINKDKFASYMITVTSHAPYMYSSEWGDEYLSLFDDLELDKTTKRYLSKIKVVDTALEYLINQLEEQGKLDDTVLVLFGDHYPYALSDSQYQSIADYDISINQEVDRTPFIIYNSETEGFEITKYTSPLDYTPTLLNLFGIEYDPRLYLGNDVFSDYKDFVLFPDNSWQSADGFYSATKGDFTSSTDATTITDEQIIELNNEVNTLRNMSALAIKKNYFDYLFDYMKKYEAAHPKEESKESTESTEETIGTEE